MKYVNDKIHFGSRAFTLVEILAALTIGTMVLIVVLAIYSRAQSGAAAVLSRLESNRLPREIFQRMAEDLDNIMSAGEDARISIENKFQDSLPVAKMELTRLVNDAKDQPQQLERVVWQSSIEPDTGLLALYRSHSGIALEDKLLDDQKQPWQRELFVPICTGLTFFRIEIPKGETVLDKWADEKPPTAVKITMSFVEPYKTATGTFDVPEQDKIVRTVALDRTRKPAFTIPAFDANQLMDANRFADTNRPADANSPAKSKTTVTSTDEPEQQPVESLQEQ
jgi:hypothetical protein